MCGGKFSLGTAEELVAQQFIGNTDEGEKGTAAEIIRSPTGFPPNPTISQYLGCIKANLAASQCDEGEI